MAATDTSSGYFRRLSSRIGADRGGIANANNSSSSEGTTPNATRRSNSIAGGSHSSAGLMTQVQQATTTPGRAPSLSRRSPSSGPASNGQNGAQAKDGDAEIRNRLKRIQHQAKNLSPMNPAKYAPLLMRAPPNLAGRKCLVLDVDETLVHSSYKPTAKFDVHLACEVNGGICNIYVSYRPNLKEFLNFVKDLFEVVIFTASVDIYCNPLMDRIDPENKMQAQRLFRDHCSSVNGSYVKDLSLLGRNLDQICIIDNSPVAYLFQPRNAIPITSWFDDPNDTELMDLMPTLRALAEAPDVYDVLDPYNARLAVTRGT